MPLERIYINEAGQLLAIKSTKALEKWCLANGVSIYIERGRKFMCRIEFLSAVEKPFIQSLKKKYGIRWKEMYHLMEANDTAELADIEDNKTESLNKTSDNTARYKPKSQAAKRFIQAIQKDL
jgi:hypothetical protein